MRFPRWMRLSPLAFFATLRAVAQAPLPELKYEEPPGFYRSAIYPPADFSSREVNASLQVYPFRPFRGDVGDLQQAFARTLLRELVDPRYQESNVAPGARIDAVAIVDASAVGLASWQRVLAPLNAFAATLRVVAGSPEPVYAAPSEPVGRAIAGLYMAFTRKYVADLVRGPAYGRYVNAPHFYLFSADGRVYRAYDELQVPGNDPARFDFAAAQRADPVNSGRYTVRGDSIYVRLGAPQQPEAFAAPLPTGNAILIGSVRYTRQ